MKIKVSDYIANFMVSKGINTAFVMTGGCIVHQIDSFAQHPNMNYVPMLHEQSTAMAADGYARISGVPGLVAATSGPGATNLLTGICCSYYDSIPVIAITGQVSSKALKRDIPTRQVGFQETDVVSIFKSVTKYIKLVTDATTIKYELEKSFSIATSGRKGPVLLDICEDVLFSYVEDDSLVGYSTELQIQGEDLGIDEGLLNTAYGYLKTAKRPVVILGGGVRYAPNQSKYISFIESLGIPVLLTWGAYDFLEHSHSLFAGGFGVTSARNGNFVVQNADVILSIGTRFDSHEIGSDPSKFAPSATRIVVDIDEGEFVKFRETGFKVDVPIISSVDNFIDSFEKYVNDFKFDNQSLWFEKITDWKDKYPILSKKAIDQNVLVNPYKFFHELSKYLTQQVTIVTDCGSNLIWTMQGYFIRKNQRVISAFNHSPMGYSLPAAIGAAFANPKELIICVIGDGGLQINVQELAIIAKHGLNIKIFVLNNHCHGIIQGTQDAWLEGRHCASSPITGELPDPNVSHISLAYGVSATDVHNIEELISIFPLIFSNAEPELLNIHMNSECQIEPKLMYGRSIEDSHPLLPRDELAQNLLPCAT